MPGAPFAITMGDPCGVGPEIVVRLAADLTRLAVPILAIGDVSVLRRAVTMSGVNLTICPIIQAEDASAFGCSRALLPTIHVGPDLPDDLGLGVVDARAGAAAYNYITTAIDLALAGAVSAVVTAPIHKEALHAAGIQCAGHTEILAARSGVSTAGMMLANDELRVLLVSIHVSLRDAIAAVTVENELRAIHLAHDACLSFGLRQPRVAVAGLNPHASENGMFGTEERDFIATAVSRARAKGINVSGPWAADTVFMRARKGEFDVVVAQYHDQGLIPVKYLGVEHGVNITVGLPFIRTSVDHGTAFDIAGTGRASHASLAAALRQAVRIARLDTRSSALGQQYA